MTTPGGKLSWGQAGAYDAIDDRGVIAAVTGGRTGVVGQPVTVLAGTGLAMTVKAGWLAVVACGDGTSAVIGSRTDLSVNGNAGPASGSRTDLIWGDLSADNATWSMSVITAPPAQGRTGIALATLLVPQGANAASAFTMTPADPLLERRLLAYSATTNSATLNATQYTTTGDLAAADALVLPGHWYRVRFSTTGAASVSGSTDCRLGVGWRAQGSPVASSVMARAVVLPLFTVGQPVAHSAEWVYRYPVASAAAVRTYSGRMWCNGGGSYKPNTYLATLGDGLAISVEDLGT
jgi:hypothetical protein